MSPDKTNTITAVVLTLNEETNIRKCLQCIKWADRLVVVDSGSSDRTIEYSKDAGADIFINPWTGFADQRNWAIDNTKIDTEWVLFIEADEEVSVDMKKEVLQKLKTTSFNAFYICYKVMFLGKWVKRSSCFPVWHPRIVRLGKGRFKNSFTGHGETWGIDGTIGYISEPYIHYSFSKGLDFWFEKHNRLSKLECTAYFDQRIKIEEVIQRFFLKDQHQRRQALRRLSYHLPFRAFFRFFYQLIIKGGILDGPAGWTYCSLYLAYEIMISAKIREQIYYLRN